MGLGCELRLRYEGQVLMTRWSVGFALSAEGSVVDLSDKLILASRGFSFVGILRPGTTGMTELVLFLKALSQGWNLVLSIRWAC